MVFSWTDKSIWILKIRVWQITGQIPSERLCGEIFIFSNCCLFSSAHNRETQFCGSELMFLDQREQIHRTWDARKLGCPYIRKFTTVLISSSRLFGHLTRVLLAGPCLAIPQCPPVWRCPWAPWTRILVSSTGWLRIDWLPSICQRLSVFLGFLFLC